MIITTPTVLIVVVYTFRPAMFFPTIRTIRALDRFIRAFRPSELTYAISTSTNSKRKLQNESRLSKNAVAISEKYRPHTDDLPLDMPTFLRHHKDDIKFYTLGGAS